MKYKTVTDENKINDILDLILSDNTAKNYYRISRIDSLFINFYFQLSETLTIIFKVFKPTQFGIDTIKERELIS